MQRITGAAERWLLFMGQKYPVNFSFYLKIKGIITSSALKVAVSAMKDKHTLAFTRMIDEKGGLKVMTTEGVDTPEVITRENVGHWTELVKSIFADPFENEKGPFFRVVLRPLEDATEVVFVFHHAVTDGIGAIHFIKDVLLSLAGEYSWQGDQGYLPKMSQSIKEEIVSELEKTKSAEIEQSITDAYKSKYPPYDKNIKFIAPDFEILPIVMEAEELQIFKDYGKKYDLTVHSLLASIMLKTSAEIYGEESSYTRHLQCPVNMRNYVKEELRDRLALYNGLVFADVDCANERSYIEIGRKIQEKLKHGREDYKDILRDYWDKEFEKIPYSENFMATVVEPPAAYDFSLSNIGVIQWEKSYGDLEITEVYGPILTATNAELVIGVNTSGGRLFITMVFDTRVYSRKKGMTFYESVKKNLKDFLNNIFSQVEKV